MSTSRRLEWSVAPTLWWFVVLLSCLLPFVNGGAAVLALLSLVDRAPGGDDDLMPQLAGPAFVQEEATRHILPTDEELEQDFGAHDDDATRVADASGDGDPDAKPARAVIEDVCVDGTDAACARWAMDGYYESLTRAAAGTGLTRVSLWGDSVTAEGYIADGMRLRLGKTYGDGGAGWVFLAKPSGWYQNTAVRQSQSEGWVVHSIIHNGDPDGLHGYGGAAFDGTAGDTVTFKTAKKGTGSKVARAELYYLAFPGGGDFDLVVDGTVVQSIDTSAEQTASAYAAVDVSDGAHTIKLAVTSGRVRAYGITLEREQGAVVDSLGVVSNTTKHMGEIDGAHWREQLAHRDADLMMILLGANESVWLKGKKALKGYDQQWRKVLGRVRKGNPDGACLVIGTLDAGELVDKKFVGRPVIDAMHKIQRAAAKAEGCAFWDARAFMGGKDAAKAWYKKRLMSGDFEHLTKKGGKVLGSGIVEALEAGYAHSQSR